MLGRIVEKVLFKIRRRLPSGIREGAHVNDGPRISNPEKKETHKVLCIGRKGRVVDVFGKGRN